MTFYYSESVLPDNCSNKKNDIAQNNLKTFNWSLFIVSLFIVTIII